MGFFSGKTEVIVPPPPPPSRQEKAAFRTAGEGLESQRALEEEQLGIQRGFLPLATNLQQMIMQRLIETFTPEGLKGQAGLVGQAFKEPFRQAEEELIAEFQARGFDPFGTTPGAQALGQFGATKASAISQAILQNLQFSSELGIRPVEPFVPQPRGAPLASPRIGRELGGTLGGLRAATFKPEILHTPGIGGEIIGGIAKIGAAAASALIAASDMALKENVTPIDEQGILESIASLPISEWNYIGDVERHVGPMAQDFHEAFGLGGDEKSINLLDALGVALISIKALKKEVDELKKRID